VTVADNEGKKNGCKQPKGEGVPVTVKVYQGFCTQGVVGGERISGGRGEGDVDSTSRKRCPRRQNAIKEGKFYCALYLEEGRGGGGMTFVEDFPISKGGGR